MPSLTCGNHHSLIDPGAAFLSNAHLCFRNRPLSTLCHSTVNKQLLIMESKYLFCNAKNWIYDLDWGSKVHVTFVRRPNQITLAVFRSNGRIFSRWIWSYWWRSRWWCHEGESVSRCCQTGGGGSCTVSVEASAQLEYRACCVSNQHSGGNSYALIDSLC